MTHDPQARAIHRVTIHESGHAVIAELLGSAPTKITIERSDDGREYHGTCWHSALPPDERKTVGLAGAIAEAMADGDRHSGGVELLQSITRRLSIEDRALAGAWDRTDIDATIRLVLRHWAAIEARAALEAARVTGTASAAPAAAAPAAPFDGRDLTHELTVASQWLSGRFPCPPGYGTVRVC